MFVNETVRLFVKVGIVINSFFHCQQVRFTASSLIGRVFFSHFTYYTVVRQYPASLYPCILGTGIISL